MGFGSFFDFPDFDISDALGGGGDIGASGPPPEIPSSLPMDMGGVGEAIAGLAGSAGQPAQSASIDTANPASFSDEFSAPQTAAGSSPMPNQGQAPVGQESTAVPKPPTAWESISQVPGKWWQGVQRGPQDLAQYAGDHPFKTAGAVALPALMFASAMNQPRQSPPRPYAPSPQGASAPAPSAFDPTTSNLPGQPSTASPLLRSGGFNVRTGTGL